MVQYFVRQTIPSQKPINGANEKITPPVRHHQRIIHRICLQLALTSKRSKLGML
jgi:hypothetical protein